MIQLIERADDSRIRLYSSLKDRDLQSEGVFITEGRFLTERLLLSSFEAISVLVTERMYDHFSEIIPESAELYMASQELISEIAGFPFHRGVLALGRRGNFLTSEALFASMHGKKQWGIVVCPDSNNPENLGGIIRSAAALGYDGILLGGKSCDPFGRKCLRGGMGAQFKLPIARSENIEDDLLQFSNSSEVSLVASVIDSSAVNLHDVKVRDKKIVLFGGEAAGLSGSLVGICDIKATIPMCADMDSLNLSVAAGIFMYTLNVHREI